MNYSVKEAASLLNKRPRAIRYMINTGGLPAHKEEGRWMIKGDDLPLSEGKIRARERQQQKAIDITKEVIGKQKSSFHSMRDLKVFEAGRLLLPELEEHQSVRDLLQEALLLLACGCHPYHAPEKIARFKGARDMVRH